MGARPEPAVVHDEQLDTQLGCLARQFTLPRFVDAEAGGLPGVVEDRPGPLGGGDDVAALPGVPGAARGPEAAVGPQPGEDGGRPGVAGREKQQATVVVPGAADGLHRPVGQQLHGDPPGPGPAERASVHLAALLPRVARVEGDPGQVGVAGVTSAAADQLLAGGEGGADQAALGAPPAVQVGQAPGVARGQRPGRGVGAQQLQGYAVARAGTGVGEGDPALDDVGAGAHPVVQGEGEVMQPVVEAQPQLLGVGFPPVEGPLGAAYAVGAYGQGGAHEARAPLHRIFLAPVERRFESARGGDLLCGEGLGVLDRDPRPPVEVHQLIVFREAQCVAAPDAGQQPCPTVSADLDH